MTSVRLVLICLLTVPHLTLSAQTTVPDNASPTLGLGGSGLTCDPGYEAKGLGCEKIHLPDNARFYGLGNYWRCIRGYRKVDDACKKILPPANATLNILGTDWECMQGYQRSGQACVLMYDDRP